MRRKSLEAQRCPIARSLERVGEWWTILILRDALFGSTRFDQFQKSLGIGTNILTRRLNALVEAGMLERQSYSERPPRDEYVLTGRGRDFRSVLWAMLAWGNRHFAPEGASVVIVDGRTGAIADPILVDRTTHRPLTAPSFRVSGPAVGEPRSQHRRAPGGAASKVPETSRTSSTTASNPADSGSTGGIHV